MNIHSTAASRDVPVEKRRRVSATQLAALKRGAAKAEPSNVMHHPALMSATYGDARFIRAETLKMSFDEWKSIPSNPRQRNEIVRIDKGRADHLLSPNEKHREVALALLPDGRLLKVDGHTRTALWRSGRMMPPSYLLVDVYNCTDEQAAMDLYDFFDNTGAAESGTDRVTGAFREAGITPTSPMLLEGGISTAMRELYEYINQVQTRKGGKNEAINKAVKLFSKEIMLFDQIKPTRDAFSYGVVMGAILTIARHGSKALRFWELYAADGGSKLDGMVDAVEALKIRRLESRGKSTSAMGRLMMNYAVKAYESFEKGREFKSKSPINAMSKDKMRAYADQVRKIKGGK